MKRRGNRCSAAVLDAEKRARLCGKPATTERVIEGIAFDYCAEHAAEHDAKHAPPPAIDPELMIKLLLRMYEDLEELDFLFGDIMAPRHKRVWGYVTIAEKHSEARGSLLYSITYALEALGVKPPEEPPPDDEPGDPSGNGGGGPVH